MTPKDKIKLAVAIVVLAAALGFIWWYLKDPAPIKPSGAAPTGTSSPDQPPPPPQPPPSGGRGRVKVG